LAGIFIGHGTFATGKRRISLFEEFLRTGKIMKLTVKMLFFCLCLLVFTSAFAASADKTTAVLSGKWQFSWEARIGTESGTLLLEQTDSKLSGNYKGHIVAPKVTGTVEGNKVSLSLEFARAQPFTIVYTGTVDGDKMSGKFEIEGIKNAYDSHGENVRPSNYSWKAVRISGQVESENARNAATQKDTLQH
jgi:hypothetical protein